MRVLALVRGLEHVCCRYRLAAYGPYLQRAGHRLELRPWSGGWWSRKSLRRECGPVDVLLLQRKLLPPAHLDFLRELAPFVVFDFDDAVFNRDSYSRLGQPCAWRAERFAHTVRAVSTVVAGNRFLFDHAALWTNPDRIRLIPTCLNPERYPLAEHRAGPRRAELVWIGSSSTLRGLGRTMPLLEQLGHALPGLSLKIICDRFLKPRQLPVVRCPWSEARETTELAHADIGISWLPDDVWSRGKCGLKVLQYMAAGLPVVANPVGVQHDLVRHGETGFLARTDDEWIEAVTRLANDPDLRRHMGRAGRAAVEAHFHVSASATGWIALLERLAQDRGQGAAASQSHREFETADEGPGL
jgi:glycosyltransferase involved in cell wall biosynthesis